MNVSEYSQNAVSTASVNTASKSSTQTNIKNITVVNKSELAVVQNAKVSPSDLNEAMSVIDGNMALKPYLSVSERAIMNAIEHINKVVQGPNIQVQYTFHKATNTQVIKLINQDTNEVIREIPPEKFLDMVADRMKVLGLYVDEKG